jgi:hypothetical protein
MAFIYEVNGQRVEFEKEPTAADIDEAARSLGSTPQPQTGMPNMAPQAASAAKQLGAMAPEAMNVAKQGVQALGNMPIQQAVRGAVDVGSMMAGHPPYATMFKAATDTASGTPVKEVIGNTVNAVRQGAGALGGAAKGLGGALLRGAMAPESAFLMPYQMAAYEQEKIRANPNAPGLENNPYAQVQRGEFATQKQAGAANQRMAVANQRYGGLTPQEQAILEKDRLNMQMRVQAAKRVLGQQQ